jgi:hypothetical protein
MAKKEQEPQPKQRTPKGTKIPVPKRWEVFGVFEKAAKGSDSKRRAKQ